MPIVWVKTNRDPSNQPGEAERPDCCPYCGSQIIQRWGRITKPIRDIGDTVTVLYRYKCKDCERTFRDYPDGLDRGDQSVRLRQLAGMAWALGISAREVVDLFAELDVEVSRMTVWREGQNIAERLRTEGKLHAMRHYAIDRTYVHTVSTKLGVVVALDLGKGKIAVLGTLDEHNPWRVKTWLEAFVDRIDVQVFVDGTRTLDHFSLARAQADDRPPLAGHA